MPSTTSKGTSMAAPQVPKPPQYPEDWQPPKSELWSIPPIITGDTTATLYKDEAIRLRQGIVCEVHLKKDFIFQNVNGNEDDIIDFSMHGDVNGIWGRLNPGTLIKARTTIYFINRTHEDVLLLAAFKQN